MAAVDYGAFLHGSVDYQINRIFSESDIFKPGSSRHRAKTIAREALGNRGLPATSANIAEHTALHSYTYARDCKDTWHALGSFARVRFNLKDMTRLNGRHVEAYLLQRVADGISYNCWKKEAAHLGKLENALVEWHMRHSGTYCPDIRDSSQDEELRVFARESLGKQAKRPGHFSHPEEVIAGMASCSGHKLAVIARIQLESGARCREACLVSGTQLKGERTDSFTGKSRGAILLTDTKGGKPRTVTVSPSLFAAIKRLVDESDGVLKVNRNTYARAVRQAAENNGETVRGTHAFRYCFARRRYKELTTGAEHPPLSHEAALQQVSWEMGHERADITMLYLR